MQIVRVFINYKIIVNLVSARYKRSKNHEYIKSGMPIYDLYTCIFQEVHDRIGHLEWYLSVKFGWSAHRLICIFMLVKCLKHHAMQNILCTSDIASFCIKVPIQILVSSLLSAFAFIMKLAIAT